MCQEVWTFYSCFFSFDTLWGSSTFLISQRRKLRFWKVKSLAPGHTIVAEGGFHTWGACIRLPNWDVACQQRQWESSVVSPSVPHTVVFRRLPTARGESHRVCWAPILPLWHSHVFRLNVFPNEENKKKEQEKRKYADFLRFNSLKDEQSPLPV